MAGVSAEPTSLAADRSSTASSASYLISGVSFPAVFCVILGGNNCESDGHWAGSDANLVPEANHWTFTPFIATLPHWDVKIRATGLVKASPSGCGRIQVGLDSKSD